MDMDTDIGTARPPPTMDTTLELPASMPPELAQLFQGAAEGQPLAQLRGVPRADLESHYAQASGLLMAGQGQAALVDLAWLVAQDPWDARFEFAFALALQFDGQSERAAMHYLQVQLLDPDHVGSALRLAECLESLGEHSASAEAYRRCVQISWQDSVHADIRSYAEAGLDRLAKGETIGAP